MTEQKTYPILDYLQAQLDAAGFETSLGVECCNTCANHDLGTRVNSKPYCFLFTDQAVEMLNPVAPAMYVDYDVYGTEPTGRWGERFVRPARTDIDGTPHAKAFETLFGLLKSFPHTEAVEVKVHKGFAQIKWGITNDFANELLGRRGADRYTASQPDDDTGDDDVWFDEEAIDPEVRADVDDF